MKRRDEPCVRLGLALVGAVVLLLALPGPSTAKLKARSLTTSQASILDHGFKIKLANTGRADKVGRVRVRTRTFDDPARKPLTKPKRVRVDARSKRRVRLRLTPRGRDAVTACGARELLVEFKRSVKRRGQLQRTSDGCRPGPVDLSRAGECDFIGQQEGSLCMLPFPDDFYTVADPSTATGRRIDFEAAAMPANGAGTPIAPGPYNLNDGFSPGQSIVLKVPGLDTPAALAQTDPVAAQPPRPLRGARRAGRRHRRDHRRALADLGRARLQRREPGRHRADDQPGGQLRLRASLHRRPARPEDGRTARRYRRRPASATTATSCPATRRRSTRSGSASSRSSRACAVLGSGARTSTSRGTSRSPATRTSPGGCCTSATTPSRPSATRRWPTWSSRASSPAFSVDTVDDFTAGQDPNVARRIRGTYTVPCYMHPDCEPGGRFALGADGVPEPQR